MMGMLKKRIIPCLDVDKGRVVKGTNFVDIRDAGDPVELAELYYHAGADEICFLDITASHEERKATHEVIAQTAKKVFVPLTVGGGVNTIEDIEKLLRAGADKTAINSGAVRNPQILRQGAEHVGSQCIVLAADVKRISEERVANFCSSVNLQQESATKYEELAAECALDVNSRWEVYVRGGREATGIDALKWINYGASLGAGEILLTSMDADGSKAGYDVEVTQAAHELVNIPIIASGGAGSLEHIIEAFEAGADAALLASLLHYKELTVAEIKQAMLKANVATRV